MLLIGPAALGCFLPGALSGIWVSGVFLATALLLMLGLDPNLPQDAGGRESVPLYVAWFFLSIVFIPVWLGVF